MAHDTRHCNPYTLAHTEASGALNKMSFLRIIRVTVIRKKMGAGWRRCRACSLKVWGCEPPDVARVRLGYSGQARASLPGVVGPHRTAQAGRQVGAAIRRYLWLGIAARSRAPVPKQPFPNTSVAIGNHNSRARQRMRYHVIRLNRKRHLL